MSKEDPKPGRWVLPVVIAALIGFTYIFVNALPAADVAASTSTTLPPTSTTTQPPSTTTTLSNEILAFLQEIDRFEGVAAELLEDRNAVNDAWEADELSLGEAEAGFLEVKDAAQSLANQVAATSVPEPFQSAWPKTITDSQALVTAAQAVVDGLLAPDDGSLRREAVIQYGADTATFLAQLDAIRALTP